jgi:hypothetical protein
MSLLMFRSSAESRGLSSLIAEPRRSQEIAASLLATTRSGQKIMEKVLNVQDKHEQLP